MYKILLVSFETGHLTQKKLTQ